MPTNKDDINLLHPMGSKTLPGIFAGYHQQVGGQWSGDVYVVPLVYIERNNQEKPHCRRIPAANMTRAKKKGYDRDPEDGFIFPVRRIKENYGEEARPVSSDSSSSSSSSSDEESSSECNSKESATESAEAVHDVDAGREPLAEEDRADYWVVQEDRVVRVHQTP